MARYKREAMINKQIEKLRKEQVQLHSKHCMLHLIYQMVIEIL